jgi:hypothetical protein
MSWVQIGETCLLQLQRFLKLSITESPIGAAQDPTANRYEKENSGKHYVDSLDPVY